MINVVETFSGIGSQAKALKNIGVDYNIAAISEWDINAIIAYDLIHHGNQDLTPYMEMSKNELVEKLSRFTLSPDGKEAYKPGSLRRHDAKLLRKILCAIERSNNLVSIVDIKGSDLPQDIDLFTYSFPCQDLSIAGVWHGNMSGIDRNANNRSGMLWQVERILQERVADQLPLPKFLLMENVKNIQSARHKGNFQEWIDYLSSIGYYSQVYCLNADHFGIPQKRERVYMLSVYVGNQGAKLIRVMNYFETHNLESSEYVESLRLHGISVPEILRIDYSNELYKKEAEDSQLNDTPSRRKIVTENQKIFENEEYIDVIKTITTKQDRHPNSGVIEFDNPVEGKLNYRYLTPRECFLAMGFSEEDFNIIKENNCTHNGKVLFGDAKLIKMAGNSIVVNVLEAIFKQMLEIMDIL